MGNVILTVKGLDVSFTLGKLTFKVLKNVNLEVATGETLGLIGESGSGKSVPGLSIVRLLPPNADVRGEIVYKGVNLLGLEEKDMEKLRGKEIMWIPQNSDSSLDPTFKVGDQLAESLIVHSKYQKSVAIKAAKKILQIFGFKTPENIINKYPFELSGGMKQRVLTAMAITAKPSLLIFDEPTKGLDAVIKKEVTDSINKLKEENPKLSILLITHDLNVVERLCSKVAILYSGEVVEIASTNNFLEKPLHPYSQALLDSLPSRGFNPIPGESPSLLVAYRGCCFESRCPYAFKLCKQVKPEFVEVDGSLVRCHLYGSNSS